MTQQKTLAAVFIAGALSGGFTGTAITTDDGTVAPAEVRAIVVEDLYETPTVAHLDRLRAKHRCYTSETGGGPIEACAWQIVARVKVPSTVPRNDPKTSTAGFKLDDRPDLVPSVQPLIDAAGAKACEAIESERDGGAFTDCAPTFVGVGHTKDEAGVDAFKVSVVVEVDGGGEVLKHSYTTDGESTVAVAGLVGQAVDVLCQSGGLCPAAATVPDVDGGV